MFYYFQLTVGAILVNNFVLSRFLGICPFLGVSKRIDTALGMGGAVIFVMTMASALTAVISRYLLHFTIAGQTYNIEFLQLILFILSIAALVQLVEIALQKISPALYKALGIYLPLITTNCAVLGVAQLNFNASRGIGESTFYGFVSGIGYAFALLLFAGLRERLGLSQVPRHFQGASIALVTAGILAMAFYGFAGVC